MKPQDCIVYFSVGLCFFSGSCYGDDWIGGTERRAELPRDIIEKLEELDNFRVLTAKKAVNANGASGLEGLVQKFLLWPAGSVSVCFVDGIAEQWHKVAVVTGEWTKGASVRFRFGVSDEDSMCSPNNVADVRVRFKGRGSWAEVGTKSKYIPQNYPTVQLSGISVDSSLQVTERRTILHEFGHVLGFEHEHQSVKGGCQDEFNWDYLYSVLGSKEQVERNMSVIGDGMSKTGLYASGFDRNSIMIYALPAAAFKMGEKSKCFVAQPADSLSEIDKETVSKMYPE
jgi:hypothetical protein